MESLSLCGFFRRSAGSNREMRKENRKKLLVVFIFKGRRIGNRKKLMESLRGVCSSRLGQTQGRSENDSSSCVFISRVCFLSGGKHVFPTWKEMYAFRYLKRKTP
jgi:hypothetical protein